MERAKRKQVVKTKAVTTNVRIDPEVAAYLQWLSEHLQRDRTFLSTRSCRSTPSSTVESCHRL